MICDVQRNRLRLIPNDLYEILTKYRGHTVSAIKSKYEGLDIEVIDEYFHVLHEEDLGFWTSEPENFPCLDLTWDVPERVSNALIDVDSGSRHDYWSILSQLDELGCKAVEFRFFDYVDISELSDVLVLTQRGRLRSISLLVRWAQELSIPRLKKLCCENPRVGSVVVHGSPVQRQEALEGGGVLCQTKKSIESANCCGQINPGYFVVNIETFSESTSRNTCLNRKVSIDCNGEIKNCPSMTTTFGNVAEVSLSKAIASRGFEDLWKVSKDQISICSDCEFRHVCTDCRAFIEDSANIYSKPSKCTYDPYTARWR